MGEFYSPPPTGGHITRTLCNKVTLLHSGKIYSSVLNNRLVNYLDDENITCDEQNGFRKDRSYRDHIFVLDSILKNRISENNSVLQHSLISKRPSTA